MKNKTKFIKPSQVFDGVTDNIYGVGNTGRITTHKILSRTKYDEVYIFKIADRGVISFNGEDGIAKRNEERFFTDPRLVENYEVEHLKYRLESVESKIASLMQEKEAISSILKDEIKIEEKDKKVINLFLKEIESKMNIKNK